MVGTTDCIDRAEDAIYEAELAGEADQRKVFRLLNYASAWLREVLCKLQTLEEVEYARGLMRRISELHQRFKLNEWLDAQRRDTLPASA